MNERVYAVLGTHWNALYPDCLKVIKDVNERVYIVPGTYWNTRYPDVRNTHVVNGCGYTLLGTHWNALCHCFQLVPGIFTLASKNVLRLKNNVAHICQLPPYNFHSHRLVQHCLLLKFAICSPNSFNSAEEYRYLAWLDQLTYLWSPYGIGQTIIFLPCSFSFFLSSSFFFYSSPNLSGRRLDVYHTSTHGVALLRI